MTVTLGRRLVGLLFVLAAVAIYLDEAEHARFACERARGTCVTTVDRLLRAQERREYRLSDIIGLGQMWSYWEEAPGARQHLAQVRSRDELDPQKLYQSRQEARGRTSTSRLVLFTRQGLVNPRLAPDPDTFHAFLDGRGERVDVSDDARLSALPFPLVFLALGLVLVLAPAPKP